MEIRPLRRSDDHSHFCSVDAKPGAVSFYSQFGFIPMEVFEGQSSERPQPVAMFLGVEEIKEA
jgi:hypothetical protein